MTSDTTMKILITGGAGFIGSHLAELLLDHGHHIHIIDDLSTGSRDNIAHLPSDRCSLHVARLADLPPDAPYLDGIDQVYHLAAAVGVKLIVQNPVHAIEDNLVDSARLLHAAAQRSIPTLIASSSEVYGKSDRVPFREDDDVTYGSTIYARWSYAMTKALDEYLALAHHRTHNLPVVITRLFNTVGPRQRGDYGMVIPRFINQALNHHPIEVYGDGNQTRCFCHVRDVVDAMTRLMNTPDCFGRVFNLGSDHEISINHLADRIISKTNSPAGKTHIPYDQAYGSHFDDLRRRVPDLTRIRDAVNFAPTTNLDTILDQLIHLAHTHNHSEQ